MRLRFPWSARLHRRDDFRRIFKQGRRLSADGITLWVHRRAAPDRPRMALAVSRHFGIAVKRNRAKRILREIFRHHAPQLPAGADMIFGVGPALTVLKRKAMEPVVRRLWVRAGLIKEGHS